MPRPRKPEPTARAETEGASEHAPAKLARHIQPLGPRVLVRVVRSPDRSEAGLFLPQGVKDTHAAALLGEVVEVARTLPSESLVDEDDDEVEHASLGANVSGVPVGANVLFEKERGVAVPWDESLRILEVRHVLAIVDIITADEIQ